MRTLLEEVYMKHPFDFIGSMAEVQESVHLTFFQFENGLRIISQTVSSTPDGCEFCSAHTTYTPRTTEFSHIFFPFREVVCIHVTNAETNGIAKINTDIMEIYFEDNKVYAILPINDKGRNEIKMRKTSRSSTSPNPSNVQVALVNLNTNAIDAYSYQPHIGLTGGDLFLSTVALNRINEKTEAKG